MKRLLLLPLLALTTFACTPTKDNAKSNNKSENNVEVTWTDVDVANGYGILVSYNWYTDIAKYYASDYSRIEYFVKLEDHDLTDLRIRTNGEKIDYYYGTGISFVVYRK